MSRVRFFDSHFVRLRLCHSMAVWLPESDLAAGSRRSSHAPAPALLSGHVIFTIAGYTLGRKDPIPDAP